MAKLRWKQTAVLFCIAMGSVYLVYVSQAIAGKSGTQPAISTAATAVPAQPSLYWNGTDRQKSAGPATTPAAPPVLTPANAAALLAALSNSAGPATEPVAIPMHESEISKPVLPGQVAINDGTVEIHVNDASLVEVLRMLSLQSQTNILPSKEVHGTVTANLYDVTVREALDAIVAANGYVYREKGNVIYVYSKQEMEGIQKSERVTNTEVFHVYYTPAVNVQNLIKPVLSADGQVAITTPAQAGIASNPGDSGGNNHASDELLVVTDTPEVLNRVRKIIKDVDRRPQQILVEATILQASLSDDNALGIDFTVLGGANFSTLKGLGATAGDVLSGNISNNAAAGKTISRGTAAGQTGFTAGVPTGGARIGVVTSNIAIFLQALEEVTHTVVLANPKVLVLNKQKGEVKVARQDPFRGQTTVDASGQTQQSVEFLETGTVLIFRPYIGDDGYIRLEVHPEDSTPLPARSSDLPPTKLTTETTTNVMVKDGHTVVIGGLFRETTQTTRSQVPLLGSIPWLGALFRSQSDSIQRQEVIILLTPHIVKDEDKYAAGTQEQINNFERQRAGLRRGMMPFSRERLAEGAYEKALGEMNKAEPDQKKAMWYLDCAENLSPTFSEALALKQKLTGKLILEPDGLTIRGFIRQQIMLDPCVPTTHPVSTAITGDSATRPVDRSVSVKVGAACTMPSTQPVVERLFPAKPLTVISPAETVEVQALPDSAVDDPQPNHPMVLVPAVTPRPAEPTTRPMVIQNSDGSSVTVTALPNDESESAESSDVKNGPSKSDK